MDSKRSVKLGEVDIGRESYTAIYDKVESQLVLVYVLGHRAMTFLNNSTHLIQSVAYPNPVTREDAERVAQETLDYISERRNLNLHHRLAISLGLRNDPGVTLDSLLRDTPTYWHRLGYQKNLDYGRFWQTIGMITARPTIRF
jgi:hypothetical protein